MWFQEKYLVLRIFKQVHIVEIVALFKCFYLRLQGNMVENI